MADPVGWDNDADDQDDEEELFAFSPEDKPLVDEIIESIHRVIRGRSLLPSNLHHLSIALLALNRLPRITPAVELGVCLSYRFVDEMSYVGFYIGQSSFRLDGGGSVYTPDVGSDSF